MRGFSFRWMWIELFLLALMAIPIASQAMMVSTFTGDIQKNIADKAKALCGVEVIDADQVPTPIISDADRVFFRTYPGPNGATQRVVVGYLANRTTPVGVGQVTAEGWHYLSPNGAVIASELYSTSGVSTLNYPNGAGKWASLNTDRAGQVAYLSQYFTVADGVRVTRWNGLCKNEYAPNWDAFNLCVGAAFADYTAARLCEGTHYRTRPDRSHK
jgi:hypothetical protein